MKLEFIFYFKGNHYNSYNNQIIDIKNHIEISRFCRKNNVVFFDKIIKDNFAYKYDVTRKEDNIILSVYKGTYNGELEWSIIYSLIINKDIPGIVENGDCDLSFWHEFFATKYCSSNYCEFNVLLFSMKKEHMDVVREIYTNQLHENIFLFLEKYKNLKNKNVVNYDINIFKNIDTPKINKNVGKSFNTKEDGQIYYAWQREIEINKVVFFDVTVLKGPVTNGIIEIKEKYRFFMTKDYVYSPDGGSLSIFGYNTIYANIYDKKMNKFFPSLNLNNYKGKYYFQYILSKEFLPAFEIFAKAGLYKYADLILDEHIKNYQYFLNEYKIRYENKHINVYGKNDREIFGFKIGILKNINFDDFINNFKYYNNKLDLFLKLKNAYDFCPSIFTYKIDENILKYIINNNQNSNIIKDILYLKKIGTSNVDIFEDYLRMCKASNRYSGGRYPYNLKLEHEVMITYINQLKESKNNKIFEDVVSSSDYTDILYENEKYCILAPRIANDLVNESYKLSHCVRSYISDVCVKRTSIYFLREIGKKSTPLVTIEIKNNTLVQVRGKFNRDATSEENKFLNEWKKNKNIN